MKPLTQSLIDTVSASLKGAKLAKLQASIAVLQESIAQGGWVSRGSAKARSGFYQGFIKTRYEQQYWSKTGVERSKEQELIDREASDLEFCLNYGHAFTGDFKVAIKALKTQNTFKVSDEVIQAWVGLCVEYNEASKILDLLRPVPQITPIGLSPKVTATLKEINLDLDINSIRPAKIDFKLVQSYDEKGQPKFDRYGLPVLEPEYFVAWSEGILHRQSRFSHCGCHACGKHIPSGRVVPVEVKDQKSGNLVSLWLGEDCSAKIFGIKAVGIRKEKDAKRNA